MIDDKALEEAAAYVRAGHSYREAEKAFGVGRMSVWRKVNGRQGGAGPSRARKAEGMVLPEVRGDGPVYPDVDPEDKDEVIRRLRLENDILRGLQEVLKGRALSSLTNREKTLLIDWLRANTDHTLRELTDSLRISKSSYEYQRRAIAAGDRYAWLRPLVREEFEAEGGARGYRRFARTAPMTSRPRRPTRSGSAT